MSEDSGTAAVKPEIKSEVQTDVKDATILEHIPIVEEIDLQNAVVIMPENAESELTENDMNEGNVVVVASVSSSGELITSDGEPVRESLGSNSGASSSQIEQAVARDPNTCKYCEKVFRSQTGLKRHLIACQPEPEDEDVDDPLAFEICHCCGEPVDTAHKVGDHECPKCDKLFIDESALTRHNRVAHTEGLTCPDCGKKCQSRTLLEKHIASHLEKPFTCERCNSVFSRKYHLERHVAQTGCDGKPRSVYQCQVCEKQFSRRDNLRMHLRMHAGQAKRKKVFSCPDCQKEFHGSSLLAIHVRTHTGERPYECGECPKRFPSSGALKKHRRMHTGERPYECPHEDCRARFAAKETLNRHVRTHTGNKPHACQFCGKSFIQASQLRAHIFHHTGENGFGCEQCGKAFNRRSRLMTHVRFVHEGAEPLHCPTCPKTFVRKEDLARHSLLHSGIKPHECAICRKSFAMKSSLKIHMNTHRKEQPRSCDECGRAFIRQDCLMRHMRTKHRDMLEDILAGAEKKKLQQQLLAAAAGAAGDDDRASPANANHPQSAAAANSITASGVWNELSLTDSIRELLTLLVDEATLRAFGWPDTPVDKLLDSVIRRCGHRPASEDDFDYIGRLRENAKLLFTVVIDDSAVKSLLNNQTVDEVILHVLRLAKAE